MLTLLLSAHDGGTAWRHLLAPGEARAGFEPVGPLGLARRVGRILGIPAELATAPERLAAYTQRFDQHDDGTRSYSASRKADPFGVAQYLLSLRDGLRLQGWDGRALDGSARLADLSALEQLGSQLPQGVPDLVAEHIAELKAVGSLPVPVRIELASPRRAFQPLFRTLLEALAAASAAIVELPSPIALAKPGTDLGRIQRALLDPKAPQANLTGDGSFLLLEADTPLEAAELTASLARTRPLGDSTFVVAAEQATLDAALARQGLPTLGLASSSHLRPHLQVLPLRLTLAFRPQDPFRAAELLLLPGGPLPGHAQRTLLGALDQMPGIGSPAWVEAVEAAVSDEVSAAGKRGEKAAAAKTASESLRSRIADWFCGELFDPVEGIPAAKAATLCTLVAKLAGGRVKGAQEQAELDPESDAMDDSALWGHAAAVARTLEQLLIARPTGERLSQQALLQLHAMAVGSGSDLAAFEAEAGQPARVGSPAAVTSPAQEVCWWGFVLDSDASPPPEPWTGAEREALVHAGVVLPSPGERRDIEASGWRQPILQARERVVLVRWRLAGADAIGAHAFHDELSTRVVEGALGRCTIASERVLGSKPSAPWKPATAVVPPASLLAQRPAWKVPAATLKPAGNLSASSLESYLGCPFRWALRYQARLSPGGGVNLPEGNRLLGDFAHRILQDMLCGPEKLAFDKAKPADAHAWAATAFDARVALEAAPLVRRGGEVELDRARTLIANAAASLLELLKRSGWRPVDAEREVTGTFAGQPAAGYVDLVVEKGGTEALVDLKLSGLGYRQEELEKGLALQIALYASLLRKGGKAVPPSGFFILEDGQLLTTERQAFAGATVVDGPGSQATLKGSEEGFRYWQKVLAKGVLPVLHEELDWEPAVTAAAGPLPAEDSLALRPPPCRFCDYQAICVPAAIEDEEVES
jgi:hypothetical protein